MAVRVLVNISRQDDRRAEGPIRCAAYASGAVVIKKHPSSGNKILATPRTRLRLLRASANLSLQELAVGSGVALSTLARVESATWPGEPSFLVLRQVADYFGISTDWLTGRRALFTTPDLAETNAEWANRLRDRKLRGDAFTRVSRLRTCACIAVRLDRLHDPTHKLTPSRGRLPPSSISSRRSRWAHSAPAAFSSH